MILFFIFLFFNVHFVWQSPTQNWQNETISTGWNNKIVILKKTTLQLYFKTFIEKINSGNLIM